MNQTNRDEIRKRLLEEISSTESLIKEYLEMTQPIAPDASLGRLTRMDAIINQSVTESIMRQAEIKLSNLKKVLSKLEDDNFGNCLKCRKPIPIARIMFMPESLYCVNCAK